MSSQIEIMGAYFPGWLLASLLGIVFTIFSRIVLEKVGLHRELVWPVPVYISLTVLWSGALWMLLFN